MSARVKRRVLAGARGSRSGWRRALPGPEGRTRDVPDDYADALNDALSHAGAPEVAVARQSGKDPSDCRSCRRDPVGSLEGGRYLLISGNAVPVDRYCIPEDVDLPSGQAETACRI